MNTFAFVTKRVAVGAVAGLLVSALPAAAQAVTVSNGTQLQDAINSVADGTVIELTSGTYTPPGENFTIYPDLSGATKSFTIRAAQGATANLTASGATGIVRLTTPKLVTFQNLNFTNSKSQGDFGSVISMNSAQASFIGCTFQNNSSVSSAGGGGVRMQASSASFQNCTWSNNTATSFGAGITAELSSIFIRDSQFLFNRIDVPNHTSFSAGGAIHVNSCTLRVSNSRFDSNGAAYVGGAIYALGPWGSDYSKPVTDVVVSNCLFVNNTATRLSGDALAPEHGGAVMMEDQTYGRFYDCRFVNNTARQGGALASYRARTDVQNCVFQDNRATTTGRGDEGFGGSISVISDDGGDATTGGGKINRPSGQLTVIDTLIRGTPGVVTAGGGGGIFAAGDLHANFGIGVQKSGKPDENRAIVTLKRVAFANLTAANGSPGSGGALSGDFVTLDADNVIVEGCSSDSQGGGFRFVQQSSVAISNSTFVGNSTALLGGAMAMVGGDIHVTNSNIVDNDITGNGAGKAFWLLPQGADGTVPDTDVTGTIENCTMNNSSAGAVLIYDDGNPTQAPYNRVQYNNNKIYSADPSILFTPTIGYKTADQLNPFVARFGDGSSAIKSTGGNSAPGAAVPVGAILPLPPVTLTSGAPGETLPLPVSIAYAASGATAVLDATAQRSNTGAISTIDDGAHALTVGGKTYATVPQQAVAGNIATRLPVGTGQNVLIGGFIIKGPVDKRVIIRAIGPSLKPFFPTGALEDPDLELHDASGALIAKNNNWRATKTGRYVAADQEVEILGTGVAPTDDAESAIIATLSPGAYTAVVGGAGGSTGIAVVEVYDLDPIPTSTLSNLATRGFVAGGSDVMIGGFIYLRGAGATKIVVRGIGPSLKPFGIDNPLTNPAIEVHDANGFLISTNNDWQSSPDASAISAAGLQPSDPSESALLLQSPSAGAYTAILTGTAPGVGVVEVYVF